MIGLQQRWRLFRRSRKAVSALEYTIMVGLVLAGVAGVLVAFAEDVHAPIGTIGADIATVKTPDFKLDD